MDYSRIVSKIAVDKDSIRLGKIIRIDNLIGKIIKKYETFVIIEIKKFFRKDVLIPIDIKKLIKVEGTYAWFNITKEEFDEEVKRLSVIKFVRETYTGDTGARRVKGNLGWTFIPADLSRRGKERKK